MEKEALTKPHFEPHLVDIPWIPTLGGVEGKKQKNFQRGKENKSRIMGNDSPKYQRNNLSKELVPRQLGNQF